jgi:hypothetical protein
MLPLSHARAEAYWTSALDSASRGERIVVVAEEAGTGVIVGTVQVLLTAQRINHIVERSPRCWYIAERASAVWPRH